MNDATPPKGFKRHFRRSGITDPWEPLYSRMGETGLEIGFLAGPQHCNSRGFVHGGLISTLADNTLGLGCAMTQDPPLSLVTATLQVSYLRSCRQGDWIAFVPDHKKVGKRISFANGRVLSCNTVCALVSASFTAVN